MKKILLVLIIELLALPVLFAQIHLSFTGKDVLNQYVRLHHVDIHNVTQDWTQTIYYPDTILVLSDVGMDNHDRTKNLAPSLSLSQNTPNPFDAVTDFLLTIRYEDETVIEVFDIMGRKVTYKSQHLEAGTHSFRIWLNTPQQYILTVRTSHEKASIKIINNGMGGNNSVAYNGEVSYFNSLKSCLNDIYEDGDLLRIIGFRQSCDVFQLSDTIEITTLPDEPISLIFTLYENGLSVDSMYVITGEVTSITRTSAVCSGEVLWEGLSPVTERGICWDTLPEPTVAENHISSGAGVDTFSVTLSNLVPETDYFFRVYAINACDTVYGESVQFTSGPYQVPTATTYQTTAITDSSATVSGAVTEDGDLPILEQGICWGLTTPTISDSHIAASSVLDSFSCSLTNLSFATTYYARAYATNALGTGYGETVTFTTAIGLPTVALDSITDIGSSYATCHGTLLSDGGDSNTVVGLCWDLSPNPTNTSNHVEWNGTVGAFNQIIGGIHNAICYVRPYATNIAGTVYGNTLTFVPDTMSTSIRVSLVHLDHNFATIRVTIVCDSTTTITNRGLCMDTLPQPDLSDLDFSATGNVNIFDIHVGNLERGSTYYLRGHCVSNGALLYSNDFILLTVAEDGQACIGTPTMTDYEGHVYNTVQIGAQCWMRSNLYTTHFSDGTAIPTGDSGSGLYSKYEPYYYHLTYNTNLTPAYGYAYNWKALTNNSTTLNVNAQGICPDGWHVPDTTEWATLRDYTGAHYACGGNNASVAKALADVSRWNTSTENCSPGAYANNNNLTGFTAVPSGGHFENTFHVGQIAYFWSRTVFYTHNTTPYYSYALVYKISYDSQVLSRTSYYYDRAFPVRCLRDE